MLNRRLSHEHNLSPWEFKASHCCPPSESESKAISKQTESRRWDGEKRMTITSRKNMSFTEEAE